MEVIAIPHLARWAEAIAALAPDDPLGERVVLVPSEAHAHALRVALVERAPAALAGTRYLTEPAAARAVLDAAGVGYAVDEELRRPLRIRAWLRGRPALASLRAEELATPGWEAAIAATIEQLEAAALRPADLDRLDDPRAADLAAAWRWLDADAGASWTVPRLLDEARRQLARAEAWPFAGPVLAVVSSHRSPAHAGLIRALPRLVLGVLPTRPEDRARLAARFGPEAAAIAPVADLDDDLCAAAVTLELYAGSDDELDAAVRWVAEQVMAGVALRDLAVLAPSPEPLATLIADRLAALPWPGEPPVFLAPGRPAIATAGGAQLRAVIRALAAWLPRDAVAAVMPRLRTAAGDRMSPGMARAWVERLGVAGGTPAEAQAWRDRSAAAPHPALDALVAIAAEVADDAALDVVWPALRAFATAHLTVSRPLLDVIAQLDVRLAALAGVAVAGREALDVIDDALGATRLDAGRYGAPAIYVGTLQGAAGLPFAAVRLIGMVESVYPGTLRGDPLLPSELRRRLPPDSVASDAEFAAMRLGDLGEIIRATRDRLAVSAARTEGAGSEREPAGLFFELAAAMGHGVPTPRALERDVFAPARIAARARRDALPLGSAHGPISAPDDAVRARGPLPGCDAAHPISAHALRGLLECPHRFWLDRVLGHRPRRQAAPADRIAPADHGALVHGVIQAFLVTHGAAFTAHDRDLAHWQAVAGPLVDQAFDAWRATSPLRGPPALAAARDQLWRDVRTYLADDWAAPAHRWVAVERAFGEAGEVALATAAGALHVCGRIDRIDVADGVTWVRDLKTSRRRRAALPVTPTPTVDIQLALYAAVTEQHAAAWGVPEVVSAAYTYVDPAATVRVRGFAPGELTAAARPWFDAAAALLRAGVFVRTPDAAACHGCAFAAACDRHDAGPHDGAAAGYRRLFA